MATGAFREIRTRLSASRWKTVVALIALSVCLVFCILMLVNFVQTVIIGWPEWVDVEMGELPPNGFEEAYFDPVASNRHSSTRHIYRYNGRKGQDLNILVEPDDELDIGFSVQKGLQNSLDTLGSANLSSESTPGVPARLSVVLPEDSLYTITIMGIGTPGYYRISIEIIEPEE